MTTVQGGSPPPQGENSRSPGVSRPSFASLIQLAAEARGGQWADGLSGALSAAASAGWTWERAFLTAAKLIINPQATARDLLYEVQDPAQRHNPASPPSPDWVAARAAISSRERAVPPAEAEAGDAA